MAHEPTVAKQPVVAICLYPTSCCYGERRSVRMDRCTLTLVHWDMPQRGDHVWRQVCTLPAIVLFKESSSAVMNEAVENVFHVIACSEHLHTACLLPNPHPPSTSPLPPHLPSLHISFPPHLPSLHIYPPHLPSLQISPPSTSFLPPHLHSPHTFSSSPPPR